MKRMPWYTALFLAANVAAHGSPNLQEDWGDIVKRPKFDIREAIQRGFKEGGKGGILCAELEPEEHYGGRLVYSLDILQGAKTRNVLIDAVTGALVENEVDPEEPDHSKLLEACRIGPSEAIDVAVRKRPGTPIYARLFMRNGSAGFAVMIVEADKVSTLVVDGANGEASVFESKPLTRAAAPSGELKKVELDSREFTDSFPEEKADLGPTGRNPYMILEPGHTLVLEAKEGGENVLLTITVLEETERVDGVETRVVEEREIKNGELYEVARNFFAISRKTNNVYYFGEEVDFYKDGKVVDHKGSWLSGEKGARFGLQMAAMPQVGSRHFQEVAPGVALDCAEILSVLETVEVPGGRFERVLKVEETNRVEPGQIEYKFHAPGVGLIQDGNLKLVRQTKQAGK